MRPLLGTYAAARLVHLSAVDRVIVVFDLVFSLGFRCWSMAHSFWARAFTNS
jgi:hypothetical protein